MASQAAAGSCESPVRFRVLGPVDVLPEGGAPVLVKPPLSRRVLATLLLSAAVADACRQVRRHPLARFGLGGPCTSSFLAQAIWGQQPPGNPGAALRTVMYQLRLGLGSARDRLESPDDGRSYTFRVAGGEVDLTLFDDLARQGRAAWYRDEVSSAARLLEAAAQLWRDPPLADVPRTPALAGIRDYLVRTRADVVELCMDARLALGGHREAVPVLRQMLDDDPLRGHVWAQLMLALYRDGRRDEALTAFGRAQAVLRAEYDGGPGPELADLRRQIDLGVLDPRGPGIRPAAAGG